MKRLSIFCAVAFASAIPTALTANDVIYQTGFEPPLFTADLPIRDQDQWLGFWFGNAEPIMVSTENPKTGQQSLRAGSVNTTCFRPINEEIGDNPPVRVVVSVDARLDGPQTGTLGTPEQDILSANFFLQALIPNGNVINLGGFFVSSAGRIWAFSPGPQGAIHGPSVDAPLGVYYNLALRVDFLALTLTYLVDGVSLGTVPLPESAVLSEQINTGFLQMAGPPFPITTPDFTYDPANYTAYFDNYSVAALPVTPADTDVRFAATDFAGSESDRSVKIKVVRRGYTDSLASVLLTTADGSATAVHDYLPVSTLLTFAPGEREKEIEVALVDDALIEQDETIDLFLTQVSAGIQISRPSAPLWILDDERAGSAAPSFLFRAEPLGYASLFDAPSLVPLPDGKFLAQLSGADSAGNVLGHLARFNADGSLDPKFAPYELLAFGGPPQVIPVNSGRRVLVNQGDRLARLHSDGKEDSTFNVTIAGGFGFIVNVLVQPDQKIIIAGSFDFVNGVARKNIARLHITGEVDTSFDPDASTDDLIWDVARQPDGKLVIIGWFQHVGTEPRAYIARLTQNGGLDSGFNPGSSFTSPFGFADLRSVAVQSNGRILVSGFFDSYQGAPRNSLVGLLPDGSLDETFDVGSGFTSIGNLAFPEVDFPAVVNGMVLQPDDKILLTGDFVYYDGTFAIGLVRLESDGSLDHQFKLGGTDSFDVPLPSFIAPLVGGQAIALMPDGDVLAFLLHFVSVRKTEPVDYRGVVRFNGDPKKTR